MRKNNLYFNLSGDWVEDAIENGWWDNLEQLKSYEKDVAHDALEALPFIKKEIEGDLALIRKRINEITPQTTSKIIHYSPSLRITNIEALPHGVGAKFLVVIPGEKGEWIAKQWKRKIPILNPNETLIDFPALSTVIKEPWQMKKEDFAGEQTMADLNDNPELKPYQHTIYQDYERQHLAFVKSALAKGKPVPKEVLQDYPGLMPTEIEEKNSRESWQMTYAEHVKLIFDAVIKELQKGIQVPIPMPYRTTWLSKPTQIQLRNGTVYVYAGMRKGKDIWDTIPEATLDSWAEKLGFPLLLNRYRDVERALDTGKQVSEVIIKEFPLWKELMKHKPRQRQPRPLPPDAQNAQIVPFDSQMFECLVASTELSDWVSKQQKECYGKQTKKGFRAYCRRK